MTADHCIECSVALGKFSHEVELPLGVCGEGVNGDYNWHTKDFCVLNLLLEIGEALLYKVHVLLGVLRLERSSGNDWRTTPVHLKGTN